MNISRLSLFLFVPIITGSHAFGNPSCPVSRTNTGADTSKYIVDYKHLLTMRFFLLAQNASFTLMPGTDYELICRPNSTGRIGVTGFYKWFGLGLSMGTRLFRLNPDTYGSSETIDLRLTIYGKPMVIEGYLQYYKGFYAKSRWSNSEDVFVIPDMELFSVGIGAIYIYNHDRFSIRAAYVQTERQLKSAGSLTIQPSLRYYRVHSGSGILPEELFPAIDSGNSNLTNGNFISTGLSPGYIYSFVIRKKYYFTTGIFAEVRWNYHEFETTSGSYVYHTVSFPFTIRLATGYNSDKWYIGGSYLTTPLILNPNRTISSLFHFDLQQIRIWVGTRFDVFRKRDRKK